MDKTQPNNKLRANSKSSCTLTKPETRNTLNTQLTSSRRGLFSVCVSLLRCGDCNWLRLSAYTVRLLCASVCIDVSVYLLCERCYFCEKLSLLIMNWAQHNTMSLCFTLVNIRATRRISLVCLVLFLLPLLLLLPQSLLLSFRPMRW